MLNWRAQPVLKHGKRCRPRLFLFIGSYLLFLQFSGLSRLSLESQQRQATRSKFMQLVQQEKKRRSSGEPWQPPSCVPRSPAVQAMVERRSQPLIFYGSCSWATDLHKLLVRNSSCYHCSSTTNESDIPIADVVVLHYFGQDVKLPSTKYCGQRYVMFTKEPPHHFDIHWSDTNKNSPDLTAWLKYAKLQVMDYTSTYRLDSDVPFTYQLAPKQLERALLQPGIPIEQRDSVFPVAWIASNCKTPNDRIGYVRDLMKHVGVKSYGKCLNNAKIVVPTQSHGWQQAAAEAIGRHKFYLAFENSNCDYYVTEKLVRAIEYGVIPVIMGSPHARLYLPNNHSALFVTDFASPKALAERITEINNNDTLFASYMAYRTEPATEIDPEYRQRWLDTPLQDKGCAICELARRPPDVPRTQPAVALEHMQACEEKHGTWKHWGV